jgi:hypothetical protein
MHTGFASGAGCQRFNVLRLVPSIPDRGASRKLLSFFRPEKTDCRSCGRVSGRWNVAHRFECLAFWNYSADQHRRLFVVDRLRRLSPESERRSAAIGRLVGGSPTGRRPTLCILFGRVVELPFAGYRQAVVGSFPYQIAERHIERMAYFVKRADRKIRFSPQDLGQMCS